MATYVSGIDGRRKVSVIRHTSMFFCLKSFNSNVQAFLLEEFIFLIDRTLNTATTGSGKEVFAPLD